MEGESEGREMFSFCSVCRFLFFFFRSNEKYLFLKFFFCLFNVFLSFNLFISFTWGLGFFLFLTESTDPQALSSSDLQCS